MAWAQEAAPRLQLDAIWLQNTMAQAQRLPVVEKLVLPPPSPVAKDWAAYRARFIEPTRIQAGVRFWQKNQAARYVPCHLFLEASGQRWFHRQLGSPKCHLN